MAGHGKGQLRLDALGVHLSRPVDRLPERRLASVKNMRSYLDDVLEPRRGHVVHSNDGVVIAGKSPLHSIRRLSDQNAGTSALIMGVGDRLAVEDANLPATNADGPYSGNPLSLIPFRPQEAIQPWMLVGDTLRNRKVNIASSVHEIGLPAPTTAPSAEQRGAPPWKLITRLDSAAGWTTSGLSAGPTAIVGGRVNTTITAITYDSGIDGWACVVPAAMTNIVIGSILNLDLLDFCIVREVHPGAAAIAQISAIVYDSGTTGLCTIQLNADILEITRNSVIRINGTGYYRVLSTIRGADGRVSLRCSTGATNHTAGQSVAAAASFRAYIPGVAIGATVTDTGLTLTTNAAAGTAYAYDTGLTINAATLNTVGSGTGSADRATSQSDFFTILLWMDRPDRVVEGKIYLDVNGGAGRFEQNYYLLPWRPSDLTPLLEGQQTAVDTRRELRIRRAEHPLIRYEEPSLADGPLPRPDLDFDNLPAIGREPAPPSGGEGSGTEGASGRSQWFALTVRVADLQKVGNDDTKTLEEIEAFKCELSTQESGGSAAVELRMSSCFVWGGYAPDVEVDEPPFLYRFRGRCSTTGARSNFSPPSLGIIANRELIRVSGDQHPSTECDKIDIERWGGALYDGANGGWRYIGTVANGASWTFDDTIGIDGADANLHISDGNTHAQPFTTVGAPLTGTLVQAAGTALEDSAGTFSTSLAQGTQIIVGGVPATIYRISPDGSRCHLYESVGALGAVTWEIPAPRYVGQPLILLGDESIGIFGLADPRNPGRLYFLNRGHESTREKNWLDITSPSEPLMNGGCWNGRVYVFSTERCFQINDISTPEQQMYSATELPGVPGLFARWAFAIGSQHIAFLTKDAVCAMGGGEAIRLTDLDLRPLFPKGDEQGVDTRSVRAPQITSANEAGLRLGLGAQQLWFDYPDSTATYRTLAFMLEQGREGWWYDEIAFQAAVHYADEGKGRQAAWVGGRDGKLYKISGLLDNAAAIAWSFQTASEDFGDPRTEKVIADAAIGLDSGGETITAVLGFDKHTSVLAGVTIDDATVKPAIIDIDAGDGRNALNVSLACSGSIATTEAPKFYWWEPSYINRPEDVIKRATDNEHLGRMRPKHLQGVTILADTENAIKTIDVLGDNDLAIATLTLQHNGPQVSSYTWAPVITRVARLRPSDANRWKPIEIEWHWAPEPELAKRWTTQPIAFGSPGWKHAKELWIMYSSAQTVTVTLTLDGTAYAYTLPSTGGTGVGNQRKARLILQPRKFKLVAFSFTELAGAGLRLYAKDCEIHVKDIGSPDPYRVERFFGDVHAEPGAAI